MKKQRSILAIFIAVVMAACAVLPGCDILRELPPGPSEDLSPPVQASAADPEPEEAAPSEEPPGPSAWELRFETWPMEFGFANDEGSRLIRPFYEYAVSDEPAPVATEVELADDVLEEEEYDPDVAAELRDATGFDPDRFSLAVGRYSEIWPIYFSKWQDESQGNNGRETAYNFKNLPGFVYGQKEWKLSNNKTYLMTGMDTLIDSMLAVSAPGWRGNTPAMDEETVASIEEYTGRGVVWAKTLALTTVGEGLIGVVLFERQGNDMLFSIVYMDDKKTLFWDNHAEYDETSTWRADAGEEPGDFEILLLSKFEEGLLLVLTWAAPEGEAILVLYEEDGAFMQREVGSSRYWGA